MLQRLVDVLPDEDVGAIVEQGEALRIRCIELETKSRGELQLVDDLRPEHADHEAARGEFGARKELLGDAGAADNRAPLHHQHLLAGASQVVGGDQAVVSATDDE